MKLERGINLGGYLSQCVHSTEHYDAFIQEEDIRKIASMGFDHVRLAIDYEVLEDEYGRTREEGFAYVTRVVEWCKRQGTLYWTCIKRMAMILIMPEIRRKIRCLQIKWCRSVS